MLNYLHYRNLSLCSWHRENNFKLSLFHLPGHMDSEQLCCQAQASSPRAFILLLSSSFHAFPPDSSSAGTVLKTCSNSPFIPKTFLAAPCEPSLYPRSALTLYPAVLFSPRCLSSSTVYTFPYIFVQSLSAP